MSEDMCTVHEPSLKCQLLADVQGAFMVQVSDQLVCTGSFYCLICPLLYECTF